MDKLKQKALAAALGVSAGCVSKHKALGMPVSSIEAAQAWRKAHLDRSYTVDYRRSRHPRHATVRAAARAARSGALPAEPTPSDARERLDRARAAIAELDLAERRGELLRTSEVRIARERQCTAFRARVLAIPSKIVGQFVPPERAEAAQAALTAALHEALLELSGTSDEAA